jgi:3'-5' exoribonuclease
MASFLVTDVKKGVTSNSKNYLTIVFQDATGSIEAKLWDYAPEDLTTFVTGQHREFGSGGSPL